MYFPMADGRKRKGEDRKECSSELSDHWGGSISYLSPFLVLNSLFLLALYTSHPQFLSFTLPPSILVLPSLPLHLSLSISLSSSLFFEPHVDAEQFLELLNRIAVWWRHTAILCKKTMLRGWDSESKIHDPSQRPDIECDHWHNRTVRYALLVCAFCCEWTADSEVDLEPWIQYPGLRCVWVLRTEWGAWGAERSYIATVTTWSDGIAIAMVNLIRRDRDRDRDRGDCIGSIRASVCLCPCLSTLLNSALLCCTVLCRAVQCARLYPMLECARHTKLKSMHSRWVLIAYSSGE